MASLRNSALALLMPALAACSLFADKPEPAPVPTPAPAPAPEPVIEPPPPPPPPPAPKPVPKPKPKPAAKNTKAGAAPVAAEGGEPEAAASAPKRSSGSTARKPAAAVNGPDWLQFCSYRQQSPTGILCDANTLLAQPSAKVQVYVREPSLARDTPGGRIQLREGLPRLYRFFVIP